MTYQVQVKRTFVFDIEVDAKSYKDLERKVGDFSIDELTDLNTDNENGYITNLVFVRRVKDGRCWEDGFLTYTSEGVLSKKYNRYLQQRRW